MQDTVYCRPNAFEAFRKALADVDSTDGLFRAAFAISLHEEPTGEVERAEAIIEELATTVRSRLRSSDTEAKLAHLHDVLFDVVGFHGNVEDYYSPANSYLGKVLESHQGIPITLVLIYKAVAEKLDLTVHGINSPGHFLAAVELPATQGQSRRATNGLMFVDPFHSGTILDEGELVQRVAETTGAVPANVADVACKATHREWLSRLLNNLQAIFSQSGRERDMLAMQELQQLL